MKGVNKSCSKICKSCSSKYLVINKARGIEEILGVFISIHVVHFVANLSHVKIQKTIIFCYVSNLEFLYIRFWHRTKHFIEIRCSSNHNIYEAKSVQDQEPSPKMLM